MGKEGGGTGKPAHGQISENAQQLAGMDTELFCIEESYQRVRRRNEQQDQVDKACRIWLQKQG